MQNYLTQNFLSQGISRFSASLFLAVTLAVLAGCGSGGSGGTPTRPEQQEQQGTGTGTGHTGTTTTAPVPTLTIALTNAAGATVTSITSGVAGTVKATLTDANGAVVPNSVVTFTTDATLATITPPAATALTNAAGVATVTLNAVGLAAGATTITATAQVGTPPTAVTGSIGFAVGASAVTVSAPVLGVGAAPLSAFGTTSITVTVSSGGVPVTTPQNVTFSSACASSSKAVLSTGVATVNGVATGSYRDNGCAGTDAITASAAGVTSPSTNLGRHPPDGGLDPVCFRHARQHFIERNRGRINFTSGFQGSRYRRKPDQRKDRHFRVEHYRGRNYAYASLRHRDFRCCRLGRDQCQRGHGQHAGEGHGVDPGATAGTTLSTQSNGLTDNYRHPGSRQFFPERDQAESGIQGCRWKYDGVDCAFGRPFPQPGA